MKLLVVACLALFLIQNDCNPNKKPQQPQALKQLASHPLHRFVLAEPLKNVAFDTQTGQLCRTWDWQPAGNQPAPDKYENTPQRELGEFTPTCLSLYEKYPTVGDEKDPLGILGGAN